MTEQRCQIGLEATDKQRNFIASLLKERLVSDQLIEQAQGPMTKSVASDLITSLLKCRKAHHNEQATVKVQASEIETGYYVLNDVVYVVVDNEHTGHRFAKRLVLPVQPHGRAKWVYDKGVIFKLAGQQPLTLEQAAEFGHLHGFCICCGAALDDPLSVVVGIGPWCVKKHFGVTQVQFMKNKSKGGA